MKVQIENRWHVVKRAMAKTGTCVVAVAMAGTLMLGAVGCSQVNEVSSAAAIGSSSSSSSSSSSESAYGSTIDESKYKLDYSDRDKDPSYDASSATKVQLSGSTAAATGDGVSVNGSIVTITQEGVYVLSGTLQGQVVVDAPEDVKVQLVLDGADITNESGTALFVKQADKCFVTLASGSANSLTDGSSYTLAEGEDGPDATLYSMCDLTLQGSGSLTVTGNYNDAVKTKDDLVITGGTYNVTAKGDGFMGKDSVKVLDGILTVKATEGDGIKSNKDDDESKGFVSIDGGTITIDAGDKGVKAQTYLRVTGGTLSITSADDALHCDGSVRLVDGNTTITAGDDAVHANYVLQVDGGTVDVKKCYEGYEGQTITLNGGNTHIIASDDGINASSGSSGSDQPGAVMSGDGGSHRMGSGTQKSGDSSMQMPDGEAPSGQMPDGQMPGGSAPNGQTPDASASSEAMPSGQAPSAPGQSGSVDSTDNAGMQGGMRGQGGGMGGGMMDSDESCTLTINDGYLFVESQGDGLDSNGAIIMNGGTVYVSGPTSSGDGALDCGTSITSNGGTLIAVGSAGMAESFSNGTQPFAQASFEGSAGIELQVTDASGAVLASFTPTKAYQSVVVTTPAFTEGSTYTLKAGSTTTTFTASTTATSTGMGGMGAQGGMGGMNDMGGRGGMKGQRANETTGNQDSQQPANGIGATQNA